MNSRAVCSETKRQPLRAFTCGLVCLGATCMFVASSCIPVLSTQKKAIEENSPALIKPTLQARPTEDLDRTPDQDTTPPASSETSKKEWASGSGLWKRVSGIMGSRPASKTPPESAGLIKPALSDQSDSRGKGPPTPREQEPPRLTDSQSRENTGLDTREKALDVRQSKGAKESRSGRGFREFDRPVADDSEIHLDAKREKSLPDESSNEVKGGQVAKPSSLADEKADPFPKHDHSKYVTTVRHKAIDILNRATDCDIARLCRDSLTDEWSLILYFKTGASFYYVMHSWDEIEGKWSESFVSEKRPVSGLKKHLTFSASGKTCKVLKGSDKED